MNDEGCVSRLLTSPKSGSSSLKPALSRPSQDNSQSAFDNPSLCDNPVEALPSPEKFLHNEFDPVKLMSNMCDLFFSSYSGLTCFVRASLISTTRTVEGHACNDLWPVPPLGGDGRQMHVRTLGDGVVAAIWKFGIRCFRF